MTYFSASQPQTTPVTLRPDGSPSDVQWNLGPIPLSLLAVAGEGRWYYRNPVTLTQDCYATRAMPGNGTTLTEADAQDAGGSYFEHILLCTTSEAYDHQSSISCGTAGPAVVDSEGPSSIIKGPNILSFVAKSVLLRFTRFLVVTAQTKHCQIGQLHD